MRILITWIGLTDLRAAAGDSEDAGPVLRLLRHEHFDKVHLLNDVQPGQVGKGLATPEGYRDWLARQTEIPSAAIQRHDAAENLRNQYGAAYEFTRDMLTQIRSTYPADAKYGLLLSPGYPATQVALVIAAQTLFPPDVQLFNTWKPQTATTPDWEQVDLPFALSIDVGLPHLLRRWQHQLAGQDIHPAFDRVRGTSAAIRTAKQLATRVAAFDSVSVLLRGQSGTGKELFARGIHDASRRRDKRFLAINCAAIPRELLESELFGHARGAFTGATAPREGKLAAANGGTLFLDEVGDMPLELQAKLLRFLQERRYTPVGSEEERTADVRVLAATHQDLLAAVAAGRFRADLYYRLDQVTITLPALRERGEADIPELARHALEQFWQENRVPAGERKRLTEGAVRCLARYPWPGNVRELQNAVARLAVFAPGPEITEDDVRFWVRPPPRTAPGPLRELPPGDFLTHLAATVDELLARFRSDNGLPFAAGEEADLFEDVLQPLVRGRAAAAAGGNLSRAGKMFQKAKMDDTPGKPDERRLRRYREMEAWLDEDQIRQLRGNQE